MTRDQRRLETLLARAKELQGDLEILASRTEDRDVASKARRLAGYVAMAS